MFFIISIVNSLKNRMFGNFFIYVLIIINQIDYILVGLYWYENIAIEQMEGYMSRLMENKFL